MATINVKAAPGRTFPMERRVRKYITDQQPVAVESSAYYRRALKDGDLVLVTNLVPIDGAQSDAPATAVKGNKKGATHE
jgi:methionine aminopeptidase